MRYLADIRVRNEGSCWLFQTAIIKDLLWGTPAVFRWLYALLPGDVS